jgi:hypothetical protein
MGRHSFSLRTDNLVVAGGRKELVLQAGKTGQLEWQADVVSKETPWTVVVIPDGDVLQRVELTGGAEG